MKKWEIPSQLLFLMPTLMSEGNGLKCPPKSWEYRRGSPSHDGWCQVAPEYGRHHLQPHPRTAPNLSMASWCVPVSQVRPQLEVSISVTGRPPHEATATDHHDQGVCEVTAVTVPVRWSEDPYHTCRESTGRDMWSRHHEGRSESASHHLWVEQLPHRKDFHDAGNEKSQRGRCVLTSVSWLHITANF